MSLYPRSNSHDLIKRPFVYNTGLNALYLAVALAVPQLANAGDPSITAEATQSARYNTSFLQGAGSAVDLDLLLSPSRVIPGQYRVDVYSNEVLVGRRDIDFELMPGSHQVEACLTLDIVQQLGIDMGKLEAGGLLRPDAQDTCYDLPTLIDKATVSYDPARLRLAITVPQVAMQRGMRKVSMK